MNTRGSINSRILRLPPDDDRAAAAEDGGGDPRQSREYIQKKSYRVKKLFDDTSRMVRVLLLAFLAWPVERLQVELEWLDEAPSNVASPQQPPFVHDKPESPHVLVLLSRDSLVLSTCPIHSFRALAPFVPDMKTQLFKKKIYTFSFAR